MKGIWVYALDPHFPLALASSQPLRHLGDRGHPRDGGEPREEAEPAQAGAAPPSADRRGRNAGLAEPCPDRTAPAEPGRGTPLESPVSTGPAAGGTGTRSCAPAPNPVPLWPCPALEGRTAAGTRRALLCWESGRSTSERLRTPPRGASRGARTSCQSMPRPYV